MNPVTPGQLPLLARVEQEKAPILAIEPEREP